MDFETAFWRSILWHFCGGYNGRVQTVGPWLHDGWTYATDGRMGIRVQGDWSIPTLLVKSEGYGKPEWPIKRPESIQNDSFWESHDAPYFPLSVINPQYRLDGDGEPFPDHEYELKFGGQLFDGNRLYWFSLIPGCEMAVRPDKYGAFRFQGGQGMLAPLHKS